MPDAGPTRLGIVGVGLIGGSIGLAARRAWPSLQRIGVDTPDALARARGAGCIDTTAAGLDGLVDCDLVVLAAPVPAIIDHLTAWPAAVRGVLTDVGSTKRHIVRAAGRRATFVGGHPVAGAEVSGVARASAELFAGSPWVLTPTSGTDAAALATTRRFVEGMGARPVEMTPDEHDRAMAFVSHVPQLLSVALMNGAAEGGALAGGLVGNGFRDMTRLASSSGELWRGILATNDDYVREALHGLRRALPDDRKPLDLDAVVQRFAAANESRSRLARGEDN